MLFILMYRHYSEMHYKDVMNHKAIIIGSTGGIGQALYQQFRSDNSVSEVIGVGHNVRADYQIDYHDEQSISNFSKHLKDRDFSPTLIIIATGFLSDETNRPETQISQFSADWAQKNHYLNMVGPALIAKHLLPLMPRDKDIYFAAISAKVGSISDNSLGGWHSYRASKAALNMMIKNLSIEWKRKNPLSRIVALHPGTVDTNLSKPFQKNVPDGKLFTPAYSAERLREILLECKPEDSGKLLSWNGEIIAP